MLIPILKVFRYSLAVLCLSISFPALVLNIVEQADVSDMQGPELYEDISDDETLSADDGALSEDDDHIVDIYTNP